jgi:aminopeptidase N
MKKVTLLFYLAFCIFFTNAQECHKVYQNLETPLANLSRHIDLKYLKFQLEVPMNSLNFHKAVAHWDFFLETDATIKFYLHSQLTVDSIKHQTQHLTFNHTNNILEIFHNLAIHQKHEISIYYHGIPASNGFGSIGFQADTALWTLSQPYGTFTWLPNKEDLLDKIDSVDFEITVPEEFVAVANGIDYGFLTHGNQKTYFRKHRFPIAHYLIAFTIGKYHQQNFTFNDGNKTYELINYVYFQDTLNSKIGTEKLLQFYPFLFEKFGEYPFYPEPYGQAQFGWGGGMEHQTVSFLGNWWIELLVHELAHQWFGDLVTCATWQDLWLNEGFATYISGLYYENIEPIWWSVFKSNAMKITTSQPLGAVFVNEQDTSNVPTLFSKQLRYYKAAMVLHQLRFIMGDSAFYQACYDYLNDPILRFRQAYTQDLKRHFQNHTSFDLNLYFQQWVYGEGYPNLYLNAQLSNNVLSLQLEQQSSNPNVNWFFIPIPLKIYGHYQNLPFIKDTSLFFQSSNDIHFLNHIDQLDSIRIDPDFWIIKGEAFVVSKTEKSQKLNLFVYPNPSHKEIMLNTQTPENIKIFDIHGKKIMETFYFPNQKISIETLSPGIYILEVQNHKIQFAKY